MNWDNNLDQKGMKSLSRIGLSVIFVLLMGYQPVPAQSSGNNFKAQFSGHFQYASRVLSLAEAMPAEKYSWQPEEGVFSVERVYTHIARYNYFYLENSLDISAPEGVDVENIESITGKENVVDILERSIEHVRTSISKMPKSKLSESTEMYGRKVNGQAVLMQLITHMSEHVGQSIAYARMNGITPPWSE